MIRMKVPLINIREKLWNDIEAQAVGYTIKDLDLYATQEDIEEANKQLSRIPGFKHKVKSVIEDSIQSKLDT